MNCVNKFHYHDTLLTFPSNPLSKDDVILVERSSWNLFSLHSFLKCHHTTSTAGVLYTIGSAVFVIKITRKMIKQTSIIAKNMPVPGDPKVPRLYLSGLQKETMPDKMRKFEELVSFQEN